MTKNTIVKRKAGVPVRADHVWNDILLSLSKFGAHAAKMLDDYRGVRRWAYRSAKAAKTMMEIYPNELRKLCLSEGMDVHQWMDDRFAPMEQFGMAREKLFECINSGVSEKEFADKDIDIVLGRRCLMTNKSPRKVSSRVVAKPKLPADPAERCPIVEMQLKTALQQLKIVRSEKNDAMRKLAALVLRADIMGKTLERVKKQASNAVASA